MIRLLSYIYPITKKIKSDYNGIVEITWYNGKKLLNSKNANFSYGSLEKILQVGFRNLDLSTCKNILLLGLGGGNVIKTLQEDYNYQHKITAIEIDSVIIKIAKDEFGISNSDKVKIICTDAFDFVAKNTEVFDLIIVDLFIDDTIPTPFFTNNFWQHLTHTKQLLFNAALHVNNNEPLQNIKQLLEKNAFKITQLDNVNKTNTLLIAKKQNYESTKMLRM